MNQHSQPVVPREPIRLSEEPDFMLGAMTIRPSLLEVCWEERKEHLEPRVMQVLAALAGAGGSVVSRDELFRLCWEGRIVGEAAINRCILKLRDLAEAAGKDAFLIETVPRVGYRLLASDPAPVLRKDGPADPAAETPGRRGYVRPFLMVVAGTLFIGAVALAIYGTKTGTGAGRVLPVQSVRTLQPSIAVLPFKNLSSDKNTGYLADGVQDEILTRLAKIGSLRVISRTSADQYENKTVGIREIAHRLGVANVLEGSVQKSGDKIRINVQLIRAASDDHLWAEDYDRTADDIFSVESNVASAIAAALAARITPGERREITVPPTADPKAYDYFLHALPFAHKTDDASVQTAIQFLQQAVQTDPNFALAWAWLARMQAYIHFGDKMPVVLGGAAHAALAHARALQPNAADTQAAMGFYLYYGEMNYPAAEHELAAVHARWPNNAEALEALALIERRLGKWQESAADFARLVLLDPLVPSHRTALAGDLMELREFGSAIRVLDDALKIWPDDGTILASKADVYQEIGQLDRAEMTLRNVHPAPDDGNLYWPIMQQFWLRRQYAKGAAYFRGLIALGEERENPEAETFVLRVALGELLRMSGDEKGARESYARAIAFMLAQLKKQPDNADLLIPLSVAYAGMGDTAMALRTSEESITLFRRMNDQLDATDAEDNHMDLMARFGDRGAAIREIEAQLKGPGLITPALLRLEPELDRLRGDPRFNNLLKTPTQR